MNGSALNDRLRSRSGTYEDWDLVERLDAAFRAVPPFALNGRAFRVLSLREIGLDPEPGELLEDREAYFSMTLTRSAAERIARPADDVLEVRIPSGVRLLDVNRLLEGGPFPDEEELLLERGQTVLLASVESRTDDPGRWIRGTIVP